MLKDSCTRSGCGMLRFGIVLVLTCLLGTALHAAVPTPEGRPTDPPPPAPLPAEVEVAAYLMDLLSIDEKEQTFQAEILFNFRWKDPRLADRHTEPLRLIEDAVSERLQTIWNPNVQFVNAVEKQTFNQALTLHPDGTVEHRVDVLGRFSTPMDFQRFPFDRQRLKIMLESFLEQTGQLRFTIDRDRTRADPDSASGDLNLVGVHASVTQSAISGWNEDFSRYVLELAVERNVSFYTWRVIVPIMIIVMISFALFFVDIASYHDRVGIAMACLLACVATQFAISFSLPRISYLTPIDRFFVWTYISIGFGVGLSTWVKILESRGSANWQRVDWHSRWLSPVIFFAGVAAVLI
ncbi:hypothetical protein EWI61_02440 [Methylolobus aquaticus]|nr:hypothetical protein EWI61_02440 [Methylolobus aquaticus]